tara:strand:- start:627 stop:1292 length:666 start_codon:yes stop_codon:yes gene_type:complete
MKKFILIITILFNITTATADPSDKELILFMYGGAAMMPVIAFTGPIYFGAIAPKTIYDISSDISKENKNENYIDEYDICDNLKKLYIDADKTDMFVGKELKSQSNLTKTENFNDLFSKTKDINYACINPTPSKVYNNGCLDTIEKKSTKKASGKWYLNKALKYYNIEYVQLINNNGETAFTDVVSTLKDIYFDDTKVQVENHVYDMSRFNLKHSIQLNCQE